jgi:hypothetical protein
MIDPVDPARGPGRSGLRRFLAAADPDELARARAEIDAENLAIDDRLEIEAVLHDWDDVQAIANLLVYPELIVADERMAQIRRALVDDHAYVQLAATVAVMVVERAEIGDDARFDLVQRLLALVAADRGVLADRASYSIIGLLTPTDGPEVVERLDHPSASVRRNLLQGMLGLVGPSGIRSLVEEAGFVEPDVQAAVRVRLHDDGVDLTRPADDLRLPLILVYLPSLAEWDG